MNGVKNWLCLAGLVLLFAALRWNNLTAPLIRDEGEYAYSAMLLREGRTPYLESFLQKPPMVAYSYLLADLIAPGVFWVPRLLACLFVAGMTVLLGITARREFGEGCAWPAMYIVTPMVLMPRIEQFTANTEMFLLLPLMGVVSLHAICRTSPHKHLCWLAAGFLAAIAFWYKYTCLPLVGALFVATAVREWQTNKNIRTLGLNMGLGIGGAIVASILALSIFLKRDGGKSLWECTVTFNRYYASSSTFGFEGLISYLKLFLKDWWILFLLPAGLTVSRESRQWFWLAIFVVAWFCTSGSGHGHYYIIVMPFWALLSAIGLNRLVTWCASRFSWSKSWLLPISSAAVVILLCLPEWSWLVRSRQEFAFDRMQWVSPFIESIPVAKRVAELTKPNDSVYVGGSEPQILYYARRFSPTRFIISYPLMIPTPLAQGYQRSVIQDLEHRSPNLVVLAVPNTSWLVQNGSPGDLFAYLDPWLAKDYDRIGGFVSDGKASHYAEPIPDTSLPKASLMLFKRKGR